MFKKNKKIFITGISGLLGSHLARFLLRTTDYTIVGADNFIGSEKNVLDDLLPNKNFEFHEFDITKNLNQFIEITKGVDCLFHTSCLPFEGLASFSPKLITTSIIEGSSAVGVVAAQNKIRRVLNFSSNARYGDINSPFKEEHIPHPCDPYGIAKLAAENILTNLGNTHNFEILSFVPHNAFGLGKYDDPFRSVINIFINLLLQNKQCYIYGDGNQLRKIIFAKEIVYQIAHFIDCKIDINGDIFNLGNKNPPVSINELYKTITKLLNIDIEPIYTAERPNEVKIAFSSCEKLQTKLKNENVFVPSISLEEGIGDIITYIKEKGVKPFKYHIDLEITNEKTPETWQKKLF